MDCIELNIAPPDNPFPTGSLVQRVKVEPSELGAFDPSQWHTFTVKLVGDQVTVSLDGKQIVSYTDDSGCDTAMFLCSTMKGVVEFKNIRFRRSIKPLKLDASWEEELGEECQGRCGVEGRANRRWFEGRWWIGTSAIKGRVWGLHSASHISTGKTEVNSGIFFRCVRDGMLDGYECQLNHAIKGDDPLQPADAGAGAIFRRAPARIVVGDGTKPNLCNSVRAGPGACDLDQRSSSRRLHRHSPG